MSDVLLDLDTLIVRPRIGIDGETYDILSPDEVSVLTSHMLAIKGGRMDRLSVKPELTKAEQREFTTLVQEMSDAVMVGVPEEVRAKLKDPQRVAVIGAFSTLLLSKKAGTTAALMESLLPLTSPPTGGKRSRGSKGSTGGRQGGGSPKRRSRS